MATSRPVEDRLLSAAETYLAECVGEERHVARLDVLEAASALLADYDLSAYRSIRSADSHETRLEEAVKLGEGLVELLAGIKIHPSLALTSLARPPLTSSDRRRSGAYYTDFRLASYLAKRGSEPLRQGAKVVDPASGTGILLVAAALKATENTDLGPADFIRDSVHAADLDAAALRGVALSLSSLTSDLSAIEAMMPRLRVIDSLIEGRSAWNDLAPSGFDLVIGNPPWEKLKLSRHEYLLANGVERHYGAGYERHDDLDEMESLQERLRAYVASLEGGFEQQGSGEPDLYKLFTELAMQLVRKDGGVISYLVPAGLIRSQGTESLRRSILERSGSLEITVLENRARFFAIDTRFKFLAICARMSTCPQAGTLQLLHAGATNHEVEEDSSAEIETRVLSDLRSDLTVPEVRSNEEWALFQRMGRAGPRFGDEGGQWRPAFRREVDMTRDRKRFRPSGTTSCLPLIEGRMVHQFRHAAKRYVEGSGRAAVWEPLRLGDYRVQPQFGYPLEALPAPVVDRVDQTRVGFCDVTGQTNERSILAARIPPGVVCGNKVPTIRFEGEASHSEEWIDLWIAIANSFAFDWYVRRVITTSVNYFLLRSIPLPEIDIEDRNVQSIAALSKWLSDVELTGSFADLWEIADRRAEIDARVAELYGLAFHDMCLIMDDFALLDRKQIVLGGNTKSTVTRDLVLVAAAQRLDGASQSETSGIRARLEQRREEGAVPYVPSSFWQTAAEDVR